ncbi:hypothetical protein QYE87_24390, partial [Enterobacter hormaechei subsp. steigerwaltii]|nr:hypothetical protein [Enterobacter hormaechei subsp. steigerwaltii]
MHEPPVQSDYHARSGHYQLESNPERHDKSPWRFVVSFRVGLKVIVTGTGVVVGLNGGFVHTV